MSRDWDKLKRQDRARKPVARYRAIPKRIHLQPRGRSVGMALRKASLKKLSARKINLRGTKNGVKQAVTAPVFKTFKDVFRWAEKQPGYHRELKQLKAERK